MKNYKIQKNHKWMPIMYVMYYGILKDVAKDLGYALTIHGSAQRDLDLVAVKWHDKAVEGQELIKRFIKVLGIKGLESEFKSSEKAFNRTSYIIQTGEGYLDINVIS